MSRKLPLVVILGATGSGKTKLSLELAQKFRGEIISADSMQVYKGLDVITAKATREEQASVKHHLLDFLEPRDTCTVLDYRNSAVKIIDHLFANDKLPIVVGGTNYYIESILWKILIERDRSRSEGELLGDLFQLQQLSSEELHRKLTELDPKMADRLHPNNKRKILRSLEILHENGIKHSELLEQQQKSEGGSEYGGGLRYPNSIILKLHCDNAILEQRLDRRVDQMIEQGLLEELEDFHRRYNVLRTEPDYTKGIFQSIGFKEFHPYLMLSETERRNDAGLKTLADCVDRMKLVTRRYAKKQEKWTRNRFLSQSGREVPPMYQLDTSDPSHWSEHVSQPAGLIIDSHLSGVECPVRPMPLRKTDAAPVAMATTHRCATCDRVFVGAHQYGAHMRSHKHRLKLTKKDKES